MIVQMYKLLGTKKDKTNHIYGTYHVILLVFTRISTVLSIHHYISDNTFEQGILDAFEDKLYIFGIHCTSEMCVDNLRSLIQFEKTLSYECRCSLIIRSTLKESQSNKYKVVSHTGIIWEANAKIHTLYLLLE
jgi:hypothetical protein